MRVVPPDEPFLAPFDSADATQAFRRDGRVRLRNFLHAKWAAGIYSCLSAEVPWQVAFNDGAQAMVMPTREFEAAPPRLMAQIHAGARAGFQYLYRSYPMVTAYLEGRDPGLLLHAVLEQLNAPEVMQLIRDITGVASLRKCDAQATLYRAGDFLTAHDDQGSGGERRRVAYVLNLTKDWRADGGGLLQFIDPQGDVSAAWRPEFNVLSLFRVPTLHSVSQVAAFANSPRFAITGWFRDA